MRRLTAAVGIAATLAMPLSALAPRPAAAIPCPDFPIKVIDPAELGKAVALLTRMRELLTGNIQIEGALRHFARSLGAPEWMIDASINLAQGADPLQVALGAAYHMVPPAILEATRAELQKALDALPLELLPNLTPEDLDLVSRAIDAGRNQDLGPLLQHPALRRVLGPGADLLEDGVPNLDEALAQVSKAIGEGLLDQALQLDVPVELIEEARRLKALREHLVDNPREAIDRLMRQINADFEWPEALTADAAAQLRALLGDPTKLAALQALANAMGDLSGHAYDQLAAWLQEFSQLPAEGQRTLSNVLALNHIWPLGLTGLPSNLLQALAAGPCSIARSMGDAARGWGESLAAATENRPNLQRPAQATIPWYTAIVLGGAEADIDRQRRDVYRDAGPLEAALHGLTLANTGLPPSPTTAWRDELAECEDMMCETKVLLRQADEQLRWELTTLQLETARLWLAQRAAVARVAPDYAERLPPLPQGSDR